jgi:hypothetical protein
MKLWCGYCGIQSNHHFQETCDWCGSDDMRLHPKPSPFTVWVRGRLLRVQGWVVATARNAGYMFVTEKLFDAKTGHSVEWLQTLTTSEVLSIDDAYWQYERGLYLDRHLTVYENANPPYRGRTNEELRAG